MRKPRCYPTGRAMRPIGEFAFKVLARLPYRLPRRATVGNSKVDGQADDPSKHADQCEHEGKKQEGQTCEQDR